MWALLLLGGLLIALAVWIHRDGRDRRREIAFGTLGAVLVVVFFGSVFVSSDAGADGEDEEAVEDTGPADVEDFDACPDGVAADEPTFYVRGDNKSHPRAVMPALPKGDPAGVVEAIFGSDGYACMDPLVAVAMAQVQEGILPFTEREDQDELNDWVKLLASNGEKWNLVVDETVKRFNGMTWEDNWEPDDGDAMFLIAQANENEDYPELQQIEDATASGIGVFRFAKNYGDAMLPKDLVMTADEGWLALPEGQFARVPVMEQLDEPLFAEDDQEQQDQGQAGADEQSDNGQQGGDSQSTGGDTGGGSGGDSGGDNGGHGGGSGGGCGGSGCGSGGGDTGGGCESDCGGTGGGGDDGCDGNCPTPTTRPTTTSNPPSTTNPPTTRPPSTTTTTRPTTTTTQPTTTTTQPRKSNPSTTTTTQPCDPTKYFC